MIPLNVRHYRRTGGGDRPLVLLGLQETAVFGGDEVRSECDFIDVVEAQLPHPRYQRTPLDIAERAGKTRRDRSRHRRISAQQLHNRVDKPQHLLGVLAANANAVSATDAAFGDNIGLAFLDLDRFGRTLANARVAYATTLPNRRNQ